MQSPWSLDRIAGPAKRPLTLEQAKRHLNLADTSDYHDNQILDLIDSGVERVEHDCERVMITQEFHAYGEAFPRYNHAIPLHREPIQSIESIKYLDPDAMEQTLDPATYMLDKARRAVVLAPAQSWPTAYQHLQSITVHYKAGYGDDGSAVPRDLLQGVLLLLTERFYGQDVIEQYNNLVLPYKRRSYP